MNHETKKHTFEIGDLVFQDLDAKKEAMLIKIVGIHKNGLYICTYLYHDEYVKKRLGWKQKKFYNGGKWLHDASNWGIDKKSYKKIVNASALELYHQEDLKLNTTELAIPPNPKG
jgi:hypothetical protein